MKTTKKRVLYVLAALLATLFVLSCLVGFAACGGGSSEDEAMVTGVSVTPTTMTLGLGESDTKTGSVTATVTMSDGSAYGGSYTWSSSATSIATVSGSGATATVTAVADGSANITVTAGGVTSNACAVIVTTTKTEPSEPTVSSVSVTATPSTLNLYESKTATLTATVTMSDDTTSTSQTINWDSSNTSVATLSATTGNPVTLTAVGAGTTTITATAGGVTSSACTITVTDSTVSTEAGLSDVASKGGSVTLTDNIALDSELEVKKDTTIDLAGKSISTDSNWTVPTDDGSGFRKDTLITVSEGATLTVTDSGTGTTSGSISYSCSGSQITRSSDSKTYDWNSSVNYGAAIEVEEGGSLVIESGTISSTSVGVRAEGVSSDSEERASVTISGGEISSTYFTIWASGDADVTISGGAIEGTDKGICIGGDSNYGYSSYQSNTVTTLTITGGEISCTNDSAICTLGVGSNESAVIEISGGTISSSAKPVIDETTNEVITSCPAIYLPTGTLTITGGTISGTTAVEVRGGVVSISGGELVCLSYDESGNVVQGDDASSDKSGAKTYGYALSVYPYGKVSRTNYQESDNAVNVTVTAGIFDGDIYVAKEAANAMSDGNKWQVAFAATEGSNYVVLINESLGFTKKAYTSEGQEASCGATVSYYVFSATVTKAGDESALTEALTIGGEIVLTADITVGTSTSEGTTALTVSADTEIDLAGNTLGTGTLSSAMNTIEVSANATLTIIDSTGEGAISNGYTGAGSTDNAAAIESKGTLVIESGTIASDSIGVKAEGGTVTIDGGTIESTYFALWEGGGNVDVVINGGTISGENKGIVLCGDSNYGYGSYQSGVVTKLTITGGEISCTNDSAITTLGVGSNSSAEITISGGTITNSAQIVYEDDNTTVKTAAPAIYLPTGTLTITGGTIISEYLTAVEVRGGKVTISGGTLVGGANESATEKGDDASQSKSGAKTYGYALSVYPYGKVSRTGYQESDNAVNVSVTGGTFSGDIYVAKESQNNGADGSTKWQVSLNNESTAENASYVVVIGGDAITVKTVAYDSTGNEVDTTSNPEASVSYYIITVTASGSTGSGD